MFDASVPSAVDASADAAEGAGASGAAGFPAAWGGEGCARARRGRRRT